MTYHAALNLPTFNAALLSGILAMPAASSPQEVYKCQQDGALTVKLFPAQLWSAGTLTALRGIGDFGNVHICPSGGIDHASAPVWLAAGAAAVGMGSCLAGKDIKIAPPTTEAEQAAYDAACAQWASEGRPAALALAAKLGLATR